MKKLPRVSVHEVPAWTTATTIPSYVLPPGVTPIYSVKLGPGEVVKRGPKRVRVRG